MEDVVVVLAKDVPIREAGGVDENLEFTKKKRGDVKINEQQIFLSQHFTTCFYFGEFVEMSDGQLVSVPGLELDPFLEFVHTPQVIFHGQADTLKPVGVIVHAHQP